MFGGSLTTNIFHPPGQIRTGEQPLIFLAGPIQGTYDWQRVATSYLGAFCPDIAIANPRREYLPGGFVYESQVDWETFKLRQAAENGVILFWLAKEIDHNPERAYAQTTRFELAEWTTRAQFDRNVRIVVGIEEGYSGARYVRRRLGQDCPWLMIAEDLQKTCLAAARLV